MKTALLSVCLLASAAGSQQPNRTDVPGPGSDAPSSTSCGFSGLFGTEDLHTLLRATYDEVYLLSGITAPQPPLVFIEVDSPSPARFRRTGGQRDGAGFEVAATQHLCEIAHSVDEVAFIFAHEFGHYVYGDNPALEKLRDAALAECGEDADCVAQKILPQSTPMEDRADSYAVATLSKPGSRYNAMAGVDSMAHYRDLRWALSQDEKPDMMHNPLSQRAEGIRDQVNAARAAPVR